MKSLKYILVPALTGLLFVACKTEPTGPSQADLDTQVEAKVKSATDQLKADCDMRMMQAAQMKADSVLAKVKPATAKPATTPVASPAPVKEKPKPAAKPKPAPPTKPSNTSRPGSNEATKAAPANNKSRPGSNETVEQKKESKSSNTSRPGANK